MSENMTPGSYDGMEDHGKIVRLAEAENITPIELVKRTITETGSTQRAARALDATDQALRYWLKKGKLRVVIKRIAVVVDAG